MLIPTVWTTESATREHIPSSPAFWFLPTQVTSEHWAELTLLHRSFHQLPVLCVVSVCVCVHVCVHGVCVHVCVCVCVCMCVSIPSSFFSFIFISWRLITLQYCSGFCHTLTWISHGFTCVPHPEPPSHIHPKLLIHPPFPSPFFINKFVLYFCVSLVAVKIVSLSVLLKAELWETLMWLSSCFLCPDYMYLFEA